MPLIMRLRLLVMAVIFTLIAPFMAFADNSVQPRVAVQGKGTVAVAPDMARITIGVSARADLAADALAEMNGTLDAVLNRLRDEGILDQHLQTGGLRLSPVNEITANSRRQVGYEAYSSLNVQVYDLENLGSVLDAVVQDGANGMRGLTFDVQNRAPHVAAARRSAVKDAREKAELYADAAALVLGDVLLISEFEQTTDAPVMMLETSSLSGGSGSVPIAEGQLQISATINMVWALD